MHPSVSVIIPIFNTEKYLERCLFSVLEQSLADIEVLCIDDGSQDNSDAVVREFVKLDSRIKYIRHDENIGLGGVRNTGIRLSSAQYIASVDSDDFIERSMLAEMLHFALDGDFDVVACGWQEIDEVGNVISQHRPTKACVCPSESVRQIFSLINPSFCTKIWRRRIFSDNSVFFPERTFYEDMATTPRALFYSKKMQIIPDPFYNYCQRQGSIMNSATPKHLIDYLYCFDLLKGFFHRAGRLTECMDSYNSYVIGNLTYYERKLAFSNLPPEEKTKYIRLLSVIAETAVSRDSCTVDKVGGQGFRKWLLSCLRSSPSRPL